MITEEIKAKAYAAAMEELSHDKFDTGAEVSSLVNAALEAVESDLIAQGMEKAAEICNVPDVRAAIRASAATLRQGEKG